VLRSRLRHVCLLLAILLACALPRRADGQWSSLHQFPKQVTTVYFLDKAGNANTGLVGLSDGEIWKSTDRAATVLNTGRSPQTAWIPTVDATAETTRGCATLLPE